MGGKTSQTTTGTTTTQLPDAQQRNVNTLQQGAADYYSTGGAKYFPGQTYADPNAQQLGARTAATTYANGTGQALVNNYQQGENTWLNPANIFNPSNIPGFADAKAGVTQDVTRNLTESLLPAIRGQAITSNSLGGSRQGLDQALAVGRSSGELAKVLAGMDMQAYSQGQNMYNAAASRAPQTYGLGLAPSDTNASVGAAYQSDQQRAIDDAMSRFNFEQLAPLLNLQALQGLTGTAGQYGGTQTSNQTQGMSGGDSGITQAIGTALMLASLIPSHSLLKEEIEPATGFLDKMQQLEINTWKYKGQETKHVGPMAEQFKEIFGVGDGVTLNPVDLFGVILGSLKELAMRSK